MDAIDLKGQPLDLDFTLTCGQAFRWHKREDGVWCGVVKDKLMELEVCGSELYWRTSPGDDQALVEDYLRLRDDVNAKYSELSASDPHLGSVISSFRGLRLLRQHPVETLLSFVCTAANNIPKITSTIEELARLYGRRVCEKDGTCYHAFPEPNALADREPDCIQRATPLLGFRCRSIHSAARHILEQGPGWLLELRMMPYPEARDELLKIRGVGRKIADCVCLFALDKDEAVPVDTHIRQIACRSLLPELQTRSLTEVAYSRIAEAFRTRYGPLAGWAQQFLFYEDLLRTKGQRR